MMLVPELPALPFPSCGVPSLCPHAHMKALAYVYLRLAIPPFPRHGQCGITGHLTVPPQPGSPETQRTPGRLSSNTKVGCKRLVSKRHMQTRQEVKSENRLKGQKREQKGRKHELEKTFPSKQIRHIFKYQWKQIEAS